MVFQAGDQAFPQAQLITSSLTCPHQVNFVNSVLRLPSIPLIP
jgi:hypothetical protein